MSLTFLSSTLNWLKLINVSSESGRGAPSLLVEEQQLLDRGLLWCGCLSPLPNHLLISEVAMQRAQTVLNVKAQHPQAPVADLCHLLVGSPIMRRFSVPERGVLGSFQETCRGLSRGMGCPLGVGAESGVPPGPRRVCPAPRLSARGVCVFCSCWLLSSPFELYVP